MRSSGRTTVSRTIARMLSLRRSLRGRRVREAVVVSLIVVLVVFVVIRVSAEIVRVSAFGRTKLPPEPRAMRAVRTEKPPAHHTRLQPDLLFRLSATRATSVVALRHLSKYPVRCGV